LKKLSVLFPLIFEDLLFLLECIVAPPALAPRRKCPSLPPSSLCHCCAVLHRLSSFHNLHRGP